MNDIWGLLLFLMAVLGALIGAIAVLYFQRRKGGRTATQETEDYRKKVEEQRKQETLAARTEKMKDFMEFDTIEDDMIVQNDGTRYVMAVRCMGINYDLMSEPEMLAVEEGFANFLNTLKFPIQLYVQSRTLDLSEGVGMYHTRLDSLRADADKFIESANHAKSTNPNLTSLQRQQLDYEIKKRRNLIDYGTDIVNYIERMSSNRNILQRKYYMIVSYEVADMGLTTKFTKEEARDVAYSELYTRCKTLQAAIAPCGIESEILRGDELAELLFIAYNKDDANVYNVKDAISRGIFRLYSTATSVLEKKRASLDAKLKADALTQAEDALRTAMNTINNQTQVDISGLTEEEQFEDDTKREAMQIILENQDNFEPQVVDKALENLNAGMHQPLVSQEELDEAEANYDPNANQDEYRPQAIGMGGDMDQDPLAGILN